MRIASAVAASLCAPPAAAEEPGTRFLDPAH